jgi:hypothetical protein
VEAGRSDAKQMEQIVKPPVVKFLVGCTESEDDEFNVEFNQIQRKYDRACEPLDTEKAMALRRCRIPSLSNDRKRLQSECSSGVSTHFSCSESNNSISNCSLASGLSCENSVDEDDCNLDSSGIDSLTGVDDLKLKMAASVDATTLVSATNEGLAVHVPPPLTKRLVVNPAPSVEIVWTYGVVGGMLVANAPSSVHNRGMNDALVTLLEYGENELHCSRAVILVERDLRKRFTIAHVLLLGIYSNEVGGGANMFASVRQAAHTFGDGLC